MRRFLTFLTLLICWNCATPCTSHKGDNGFITTDKGAKAHIAGTTTPVLVAIHPDAHDWYPAFKLAVEYWNALADCDLFAIYDAETQDVEGYVTEQSGVIPVYAFALDECDLKNGVDCFPRTESRIDEETGLIAAERMMMPVGNFTPTERRRLWWIAVHELGHALGLAHDEQGKDENPQNAWSLMQPKQSFDRLYMPPISPADVELIKKQYCRKPGT